MKRILKLGILFLVMVPALGVLGPRPTPMTLHFSISSPAGGTTDQQGRLMLNAIGRSFHCVSRGGTTEALVLQLQECTAAGSCTSVGGDITLTATNSEGSDTTLTDTAWAAGNYLAVDVVSVTTAPDAVFCVAWGINE